MIKKRSHNINIQLQTAKQKLLTKIKMSHISICQNELEPRGSKSRISFFCFIASCHLWPSLRTRHCTLNSDIQGRVLVSAKYLAIFQTQQYRRLLELWTDQLNQIEQYGSSWMSSQKVCFSKTSFFSRPYIPDWTNVDPWKFINHERCDPYVYW